MGNIEEEQKAINSFDNPEIIKEIQHGKEIIEKNEIDPNQSFLSIGAYFNTFEDKKNKEDTKASGLSNSPEKIEDEMAFENNLGDFEITDEDMEGETEGATPGKPMITPGFPTEGFPKPSEGERNLRMGYMSKLLKTNTWTPSAEKPSFKQIIIFDWDELFDCIPYLMRNGLHKNNFKMTLKQTEIFAKIEFQILLLLTNSDKTAKTRVITNKTSKWINFCIAKFYPSLKLIKDKLEWYFIPDAYSRKFANDTETKMNILTKWSNTDDVVKNKILWNVNYFGNITLEKNSFKDKPNLIIKNVKVIGVDEFEMLPKELTLINGEFEKIISKPKKMNMKIDKKIFK
ncbi:MAG: hypothetical protein MJ252_19330 [archaeon]|nr:hypothetical protein [archaeon]